MYPSLNHKTALVTGAGTGIGRAIARRLADEGANVLIVGRTETTLAETASHSDKITFLAVDLEAKTGIESIIQTIGERYGRLDILVNNAGWAPVTPFAAMKINEYDKVFAISHGPDCRCGRTLSREGHLGGADSGAHFLRGRRSQVRARRRQHH